MSEFTEFSSGSSSGLAIGSTVYPSSSWLGDYGDDYGGGTARRVNLGSIQTHYWYQPSPWVWPITVEKKIRLKLSEVEVMREAARASEPLRLVLNKLAPVIEIEVDF